jgi:MOSC domain-containing protein YiiM
LAGHGGEQRAVFVYQMESYGFWQEQLKRTAFVHGQFGENFTIEGLPDDSVCIGDRYQIGSAVFEITQPRVTCYRVGIRMNEPRMPALLTSSGRPGFYFRVLQEGEVGAGDEIVKVGDPKERMTVAEINALLYSPDHPRDRLERALCIPALSAGWRESFEALLTRSGGAANRKRRAHRSSRTAPGMARIPPASNITQGAGEWQRDFATARAHGQTASRSGPPWPVCHIAAQAGIQCAYPDAQLFVVGRAKR